MLVRVKTCAVSGIDAASVDVEVDVRGGEPKFTIIGLGDGAIRESRDRVISAIRQSGFFLPRIILVNLAPAEMKKEGSSFDLPIALGILAASGQINPKRLKDIAIYGELSLDGSVKSVRGALSMAIRAIEDGAQEVFVPSGNCQETSLVSGSSIVGVASLVDLVMYLNGHKSLPPSPVASDELEQPQPSKYISEVWGQVSAKRALMIAAAGGHNILMIGPPGCGKSMLSERFSSLLPPLSRAEMLETVKIHSIAGSSVAPLLAGERPFRAPHHVVSDVGLIGGGTSPKPGEITLAHHGVLFLDEFPEYRRSALESLRAPLEAGKVQITRAKQSVVFPSRFQLIAAMNPCPCGRLGIQAKSGQKPCLCSRPAIEAYLRKLSQPILDRIDLHVELEAVPFSVLVNRSESNMEGKENELRGKVFRARDRQLNSTGKLNSLLSSSELGERLPINPGVSELLEAASKKTALSARGFVRVLRVATTIADLEGADEVKKLHVAEALSFRGLERIQAYVRG